VRLAFTLLAVSAIGCAGQAGAENDGSDQAAIVGGVLDRGDPAVVALLAYQIPLGEIAYCTGTLIAPDVVLAAGHCGTVRAVALGKDASGAWSPRMSVDEPVRPEGYSGEGKAYDFALYHLHAPIEDIAPIPLNTAALDDLPPTTPVRHVGYGSTHTTLGIPRGYGEKRQITYPITRVDELFIHSGGKGAQTCLFDSGGPAFMDLGDGEKLAAVVSDGDGCDGDSWDGRVDRADVLAWIDLTLGAWGSARP